MTNKELADLMYPNVTKTIEEYETIYPKRDLPEGAVVSRFAPSPTGFVHMGSLMSSFVERFVPKTTGGVFYLRIEDTDDKREVENGVEGIINDLDNFGITRDEGVIALGQEAGIYGPYIQSQRIEIYHTFAKWMVENDYAYPCFCSAEELDIMRKKQEAKNVNLMNLKSGIDNIFINSGLPNRVTRKASVYDCKRTIYAYILLYIMDTM